MPAKFYQPSNWNCTTCFKQKQKQIHYAASGKKRESLADINELMALVEFWNEFVLDIEMKTERDQQLAGAKKFSAEQCLPSFISNPNVIALHVLKKSYIFALLETKMYRD